MRTRCGICRRPPGEAAAANVRSSSLGSEPAACGEKPVPAVTGGLVGPFLQDSESAGTVAAILEAKVVLAATGLFRISVS